jgi:hypothetical protein
MTNFLFFWMTIATMAGVCASAGPQIETVVHVSEDYNVSDTDVMILTNSTLGSFALYLPPVNATPSRVIIVQDEGGWSGLYPVTIVCDGEDFFPGTGPNISTSMAYYGVRMVSNGGNLWLPWYFY